MFVYLFDILGVVPISLKLLVNVALQSFFDRVNQGAVIVAWPGGTPVIGSTDLVVYFLDFGHSLVNQAGGNTAGQPLEASGSTWIGSNGTLSEVYLQFDPLCLAKVAFHECMHNKLQIGNSMHNNRDGLAKASIDCGILGNDLTPRGDDLTPGNISDMGAALTSANPQFISGISILVSAAAARDRGDPSWDVNAGIML